MLLSDIFSKSFEDYKKNWKIIFRGYFWLNVLPYLVMVLILFGALFFFADTLFTKIDASLITEEVLTADSSGLSSLTGNAIGSGDPEFIKIILPIVIFLLAFFVIYYILRFMLSLAIYYTSLNNEKGDLTFRDIFRGGMHYFWRFLLFYLFLLLIVVLFILLFAIPILITSLLWTVSPLEIKILLVIICIAIEVLLVLFAIYLRVAWLFAPYVIMKENSRIFNSLSRSRALVRGRWWFTFGYFLLISIILWFVSYVLGVFNGLFSFLFQGGMISLISYQNYQMFIVLMFFYVLVAYIFDLIARVLTYPYSVFFFKNIYYEYSGINVKKTVKEEVKKVAKKGPKKRVTRRNTRKKK